MLALGVVAGADDVEPQIELQIVGLVPLHARRGGVADVGPALMAVKAVEVDQLPVQVEAVGMERCVSETHLQDLLVRFLPLAGKRNGHLIQDGFVQIPGTDVLGGEGEGVLLLRVHCEVDGKLRDREPQGVARFRRPAQIHTHVG